MMGTFSWRKRAQICAKNTVNLIIIIQLNHAAISALFCTMKMWSREHKGASTQVCFCFLTFS